MQPHQWEAFIQAIKLAHPNRLAIPTPNPPLKDSNNNLYKAPKAFSNIKEGEVLNNTKPLTVDRTQAKRGANRTPISKDHTAVIYTDGSCIKQGAANSLGAAYSITLEGITKVTHVHTGGSRDTNTNNRAELSAIHMALQDLTICREDITLFTDSLWSQHVLHKTLHNPKLMEMGKHRELLEAIITLAKKVQSLGSTQSSRR
jgi:ribonuclease HI